MKMTKNGVAPVATSMPKMMQEVWPGKCERCGSEYVACEMELHFGSFTGKHWATCKYELCAGIVYFEKPKTTGGENLDCNQETWAARIRRVASKILHDPFYSKAESVKRCSALGSGRK